MKFEIRKDKKMGRGLFATKSIKKGDLVEVCPVVVLDRVSSNRIQKTFLASYVFSWTGGRDAIGLGHGSLFNHSLEPNVGWQLDSVRGLLIFEALRDIKPGEQLLINYQYDPSKRVWKKGKWIIKK